MLGGALAGAAFGMAGYCFQTLLRNPLASPDVIGISSGTSTAAVFCILYLKLQGSIVAVIAVVFGILTAVAVYLLASPGGHFSHGKMILTGIGVAALFDAVTSYLLTKTAEFNVSATMQWLSGNLNGVERKDIPLLAIVVLGLGMILCLLERHLQTLGLGDAYAVVLGMNVRKGLSGADFMRGMSGRSSDGGDRPNCLGCFFVRSDCFKACRVCAGKCGTIRTDGCTACAGI